jgi:hypothetical protein
MSTPSVSDARICPECGKRNSGLSLFCAECGAPLMDDAVWAPPSDGTQTTSAFSPSRDPEATTAFTPRRADPIPANGPDTDRDRAWEASGTATWASPAATVDAEPPMVDFEPPESRRGFVLGVIASVLIALVIGFVVWAVLLDAGTRDTLTGWFN